MLVLADCLEHGNCRRRHARALRWLGPALTVSGETRQLEPCAHAIRVFGCIGVARAKMPLPGDLDLARSQGECQARRASSCGRRSRRFDRAGKQIDRCWRVGTLPGADARAPPSRSPPAAASSSACVIRSAELDEVPVRLLEVVADELVGAVAAVEPVAPRRSCSSARSAFGIPAVRDVADEHMVEAEELARADARVRAR